MASRSHFPSIRSSILSAAVGCVLLLVPGPSSAQTVVTLEQCVRASLAANHGLLAVDAEAAAAASRSAAATAARRPRAYVESSTLHSTDPLRVRAARFNGESGVFEQDLWQGVVGTSVPIYTGGRLSAEQAAAQLLADAADADLKFARQVLAVRVLAIYEDALATETIIRSLQRSLDALRSQQQRSEALERQQKAAGVDVLRVAVRLSRVEQSLIEAESRLAILKGTLSVLMAESPEADWALAGEQTAPNPSSTQPVRLPAADRFDEAAAQARTAAAIEQQSAATASGRPSINATVNWGPRGSFAGEQYDAGFAGIVLTWNFADFGRTRARVDEARAVSRAREEAAQQVSLQRQLELTTANAAVQSATARIEASRTAIDQALESLRIEQLRYELGDGTIVDVLDAQSAADESESLRARAFADYSIALASLDLARGVVFTDAAATSALQHDPRN